MLCDRFTDASRAYQGVGRRLGLDRVEQLAEWVLQGLEPNLTLLLDAPAEVGLERVRSRGDCDRMDNEALAFYQRVRCAYLSLADAHPTRFAIIDASQPLDGVQAEIEAVMRPYLNNK